MTTIQPKGESLRRAIKWISEMRQDDEARGLMSLVHEATTRFNLSPKEEEYLVSFYRDSGE